MSERGKVCVCACVRESACECVYTFLQTRRYIHLGVLCVCMYVCMYVCVCVRVFNLARHHFAADHPHSMVRLQTLIPQIQHLVHGECGLYDHATLLRGDERE